MPVSDTSDSEIGGTEEGNTAGEITDDTDGGIFAEDSESDDDAEDTISQESDTTTDPIDTEVVPDHKTQDESDQPWVEIDGLKVEVVGEGRVAAVDGTPTRPEEWCLTAVASEGWHFTGWGGDGYGSEHMLWINKETYHQIVANFERNTVIVTIITEGEGTAGISSPSKLTPYDEDSPECADGSDPYPTTLVCWVLYQGERLEIEVEAEPGWYFEGFEIVQTANDMDTPESTMVEYEVVSQTESTADADPRVSQDENTDRIEVRVDTDMQIRVRFVPFDWTILLYMNGDNELESCALEDLNECEAGIDTDSAVQMLALIDRGPGHDFSDGDWTGTRVYHIQPDSFGVDAVIRSPVLDVPELGLTASQDQELNTGAPSVLSSFLSFGYREFPARHTALILWGHGTGFRNHISNESRGIGIDETDGSDQLLISEIRTALIDAETTHAFSRLTLIGFDSCFSSLFESAYELKDHADYLIGSQGIVSDDGWEYDSFLEELSEHTRIEDDGITPEDFIQAAVGAYEDKYSDVSGRTISAVQLDYIAELNTAFNVFCDQVYDLCVSPDIRNHIRNGIFNEVTAFYYTPGDMYIDIGAFAHFVGEAYPQLSDASTELITTMTRCTVAKWSSTQTGAATSGLSILYTSLDGYGYPVDIPLEYWRNYGISNSIQFPQFSRWCPVYPHGPGLLFRIWYETLTPPD